MKKSIILFKGNGQNYKIIIGNQYSYWGIMRLVWEEWMNELVTVKLMDEFKIYKWNWDHF